MIQRRGFLAGILAAGVAPAFVGSKILMPVKTITLPEDGIWTADHTVDAWLYWNKEGTKLKAIVTEIGMLEIMQRTFLTRGPQILQVTSDRNALFNKIWSEND